MIGSYLRTHTDSAQCFYGAERENLAFAKEELYCGEFLDEQ